MTPEDEEFVRIMREAVIKNKPQGERMNNDIETLEMENRLLRARNERLEAEVAKRPWVGLTDEEVDQRASVLDENKRLAFYAGMYVAQTILKEKNA